MRMRLSFWILLTLALSCAQAAERPQVRIVTDFGIIEIELFPDKSPLTVSNFLDYVDAGFYDGTLFHRVVEGELIEGGAFTSGRKRKPVRAPIPNEAENWLKNTTGTVSMAHDYGEPSTTSRFFINTADNPALDYRHNSSGNWGYCVFGRVVRGMEIARRIERVDTGFWPNEEKPKEDVIIRRIERMEK